MAGVLRALTLGAVALQVAATVWVMSLLASSTGLERGIAAVLVLVAAVSFALSGLPALVLALRGTRPVLAFCLSLAFPLVWIAVMSQM